MTNEEKLEELAELDKMLEKINKKFMKLTVKLNQIEDEKVNRYVGRDLCLEYGARDFRSGIKWYRRYIDQELDETNMALSKEEES